MHHLSAAALALAPFVLVATAQVDLDMDDVPAPCKTICKPIGTLSDRCDVDLRSDNDRDEHHLQNQCICTNKSFNVAKIAALCADCMHQSKKNKRDDGDQHADRDDLKGMSTLFPNVLDIITVANPIHVDIDNLLSMCGFSSTTYNSAATSEVASITVDATRPTDISQLTTTIDRGHPGSGGAAATSSSGPSTNATGTQSSGTASMTTPPSSTMSQAPGSSGAQQSSSGTSAGTSAGTTSSTTSPNAAAAATGKALYAAGGLAVAALLMV